MAWSGPEFARPDGNMPGSRGGSLFRRCMPVPRRYPRRMATVSVHTSPLEQPGTGDAGGLNVYVVEVAKRLAQRGTAAESVTRAVWGEPPPLAGPAPGG